MIDREILKNLELYFERDDSSYRLYVQAVMCYTRLMDITLFSRKSDPELHRKAARVTGRAIKRLERRRGTVKKKQEEYYEILERGAGGDIDTSGVRVGTGEDA